MLDESQEARIDLAKWVLERQINWIATADIKAGFVVAIQTAMVGALYAVCSTISPKSNWLVWWWVVASICSIMALANCAQTLFPRTGGPPSSLLFFGGIVKLRADAYEAMFGAVTYSALLKDFADQIHRNAEIAAEKHRHVKRSIQWSFVCLIPWVIALALAVPINGGGQ